MILLLLVKTISSNDKEIDKYKYCNKAIQNEKYDIAYR